MRTLLTKRIRIPMADNVESLNVAVAASFIGYHKHFRSSHTGFPRPTPAGGLPAGAAGRTAAAGAKQRPPAPRGVKR